MAWPSTGLLLFVGITSLTALALRVVDQSFEVLDGRGVRQRPHGPLIVEEGQHGRLPVGTILEPKYGAHPVPPNADEPEAVAAQVVAR